MNQPIEPAALILLGVALVIFLTRNSRIQKSGYKRVNQFSIKKTYRDLEVTFYHWGSLDHLADGDDYYIGFYGLIKTPHDLSPELLKQFDEVEYDTGNDGKHLITVKKKKVFLGSKEFEDFLVVFDRLILSRR